MILASASPLTLTLALVACVSYATAGLGTKLMQTELTRLAALVAWLAHGGLLALNVFNPSPEFGFAPALSVTAWLVGLVYAVESWYYPQLTTHWLLLAFGAASVALALIFPGNLLHPNASAWLPLHWAFGIASYSMFAVAVVHAWLMSRAETRIRSAVGDATGLPLLTMERLTFRFVSVGFVLLSATLLAGFLFGSQLYGPKHALKLDHKTAFSALSWLTFLALMLGRARFGWRGKRAIRVLYAGAALLLLAYVGSSFVIEVILERTL